MPGLRADYAWHALCHATHRQRAGVAHPHTRKQDCSSGCAWAMGGPWVGHSRHGPPVVHPWSTHGPGSATETILRVGHACEPHMRGMGGGQAACMPRVVGAQAGHGRLLGQSSHISPKFTYNSMLMRFEGTTQA